MRVEVCVVVAAIAYVSCAYAAERPCVASNEVRTVLDGRVVTGLRCRAEDGSTYASFLGVPYAEQPLGEKRFQPLKRFNPAFMKTRSPYNASKEGPVCPQHYMLYERLQQSNGMSEACIYANIHVPIHALKRPRNQRYYEARTSLPILVFIHGGGFNFGSGDTDIHGPERLVSQGVIVITFNYRLNVFGFLSLNSSSIPGNNGLRDMITLLQWVRDNAYTFGGNPREVTLAGQSAGASAAHLLTLSRPAQGLFKRAIIMSGTALPSFYAATPLYAQYVASLFLKGVGINSTEPELIHEELTKMPLDIMLNVTGYLHSLLGLAVFTPVIESPLLDVVTIIDEDPELSLANGRGNHIPLIVGYTNVECETFRNVYIDNNIVSQLETNPLVILSPSVIFSVPPEDSLVLATNIAKKYFDGDADIEGFLNICTDMAFQYPALKVAQYRQATKAPHTYLYQFLYNADESVLKEGLKLNYTGAGHIEDLTYVFKVNSVHVKVTAQDKDMSEIMVKYMTEFIKYSAPTLNQSWKALDPISMSFLHIESPAHTQLCEITDKQKSILQFYDSIYGPRLAPYKLGQSTQ